MGGEICVIVWEMGYLYRACEVEAVILVILVSTSRSIVSERLGGRCY